MELLSPLERDLALTLPSDNDTSCLYESRTIAEHTFAD